MEDTDHGDQMEECRSTRAVVEDAIKKSKGSRHATWHDLMRPPIQKSEQGGETAGAGVEPAPG